MAIERYQGKYVSADDALKAIDMPTINDGCRMLKDAAERLNMLTKKIDLLGETYNRDAISVSGDNMEEVVAEYERNTTEFYNYIFDLADMLEQTTQRVVNRRQTILNEVAKQLDRKEALLHNEIPIDTPSTATDPALEEPTDVLIIGDTDSTPIEEETIEQLDLEDE